MNLEPINIHKQESPDEDTPIYRYLSTEAFLYLLMFEELHFKKISDWPDRFEGAGFNFFQELLSIDQYTDYEISNFFGSCWTLQTEDRRLYEDEKEHQVGTEEILKDGSAAMWESYCQLGGVRIKTTIKKVKDLLQKSTMGSNGYYGIVYYEPWESWNKMAITKKLVERLFIKRIAYRYESEFRFIIVDKDNKNASLTFPTGELSDFVDEILVCPTSVGKQWISKSLYKIGGNILTKSIPGKAVMINHKNRNQFCRISQLYSIISKEI